MTDLSPTPAFARTEVQNLLDRAGITCLFVTDFRSSGQTYLAFLVSDENAAHARRITRNVPDVTVRFFTLTGAKSGGFRLDDPRYSGITLAIFPFELADFLLKRAARQTGLNATNRFRVAAYVACYFRSSARLLGLGKVDGDEPDLARLAGAAGVDPEMCTDRRALESYLASAEWRPPIDMLERLGLADPWIREALLPDLVDETAPPAGLTVFFLRQRAVELGRGGALRMAIEACGFEVLLAKHLQGTEATEIRRSVRGGNWGAGPWPVNGGPPVQVLFAVDVFPLAPSGATNAQHPFLDNARILRAKVAARDAALAGIRSDQQFNAVHSADNSAEAFRIARVLLSNAEYTAVETEFQSRRDDIDPLLDGAVPLDEDNSIAQSYRLHVHGAPVIRKIYRAQFLAELRRDVAIFESLASEWPELPAVRRSGANFLEFDETGKDYVPVASLRTLLPVPMVVRLRGVLRALAAIGYDPSGWNPRRSILISRARGKIRILGFERLVRANGSPGCFDTSGVGKIAPDQGNAYAQDWYPVLGIPRAVFVRGSTLAVRLYRLTVFPLRLVLHRLAALSAAAQGRLRRFLRSIVRDVKRSR